MVKCIQQGMICMSNDELFNLEKKIKMKHEMNMLVDLLLLYYENNKEININYIYNAMKDSIVYTDEEKNSIINGALQLLKDEHSINLEGK